MRAFSLPTGNRSCTAKARQALKRPLGTALVQLRFSIVIAGCLARASAEAGLELFVGSGRDGDLVVSLGETSKVDVVKTWIKNTSFSGDELRVNDATGFSVGDEVLVVKMRVNSVNSAGNGFRSTVKASDVANSRLTLSNEIPYRLSASDRIVVQRIPHYRNVTIKGTLTADKWNGTNGGILAFRVSDTLVIEPTGVIDANELGFRGGAGSGDESPAQSGETFFVDQPIQTAPNASGGGGATSDGNIPRHGGGGGGGGNKTSGDNGAAPSGIGGLAHFAGLVIGDDYFILGGGGGGGGWSNLGIHSAQRPGMPGLSGGGIIHIASYQIIVYAGSAISANGQEGYYGGYVGTNWEPPRGGGGGGAGGFIWLQTMFLDYLSISPPSVKGGRGSWDHSPWPGGAGGMGWYRLDYGFADGFYGSPDVHVAVNGTTTNANSSIVLTPIPNQILDELTTLSLTLSASNVDTPAQPLTFSLVSGPDGMTVTAGGILSWTPTEAQGPSTNDVTVCVSNGAAWGRKKFSVVVREVNSVPTLGPFSNVVVRANGDFVLPLPHSDSDIPANGLHFELLVGPTSAVLDATNGVFLWTPSTADIGTTNVIVVRVTDDGTPTLSTTNRFLAAVTRPHSMPSIQLLSGNRVRISWEAVSGASYVLQCKTNIVDPVWTDIVSNIIVTGSTAELDIDVVLLETNRFYRLRSVLLP